MKVFDVWILLKTDRSKVIARNIYLYDHLIAKQGAIENEGASRHEVGTLELQIAK